MHPTIPPLPMIPPSKPIPLPQSETVNDESEKTGETTSETLPTTPPSSPPSEEKTKTFCKKFFKNLLNNCLFYGLPLLIGEVVLLGISTLIIYYTNISTIAAKIIATIATARTISSIVKALRPATLHCLCKMGRSSHQIFPFLFFIFLSA